MTKYAVSLTWSVSVGDFFIQNRRIPHRRCEGYGDLSAPPTEFAEGARINFNMAIDNQQDTKYHSRSLSSFLLRSAPGRVLMFELAVGWLMVLPVEGLSGRKQSGARGEPSRRARRRAPLSGRAAYCEPALLRVAEPPSLVSRGGGATAVLGTAVLFDDLCRRVVAGLVASATIKTEG